MSYTIKSRKLGATLDNPNRNIVEFEFVKDDCALGVGAAFAQYFGGRRYDLTIWNESEAKAHFIKWCGY